MMVEKVNFAGREYIVIDRFNYKDVEYVYIFEDISEKIKGKDIQNLKDNINAKADFIYMCSDGNWENVVDDKLYAKLMAIANRRNMTGQSDVI